MQPLRTMYIGGIVASIGILFLMWRFLLGGIGFVGGVGLVLYTVGITSIVTYLLYRVYFLQYKRVSTWVLGGVLSIISMGIVLGLPIIFWRLHAVSMIGMLVALLLSFMLLSIIARTSHQAPHPIDRRHIPGWHAKDIFTAHRLWFVLYGVFWIYGMVMALSSASTQILLSPWQSLSMHYLFAAAVCALLLVLFLFSRIKTKWVLLLIIMQSILMHVYIPASHVLPAGGDIWRHMGRVELVLSGEPIRPVLFGEDILFETVGPVVLPSVFVQPQQYAYSAQWGLMSVWKAATGYELLGISKWGMPLLWAVGIPVVFFYIGYLLFRSSRHALVISSASLVPFSMLALGSLSLPVTFGYISFFSSLLLLLIAMRYGTRMQWTLVLLSALGLIFIYPLHAIVYIVIAMVAALLYRLRDKQHTTVRRIVASICILLCAPLLPLIELAGGMSSLSSSLPVIETLTRIVGEHSGWYIASEIRPHDILSGNILFNHVPLDSFTNNIFTSFRWPLLLFGIGVYLFALYGWIISIIQEKRTSWQMLSVLAAMVWVGYGISWYVLAGEHQLVRRLDVLFAFVLLVFAWYGLTLLIDRFTHSTKAGFRVTGLLLVICLFAWWGSMSAFTLGPDMRYVSTHEYTVGTAIADSLQGSACVLADTWPLLVVEAATAGSSIGGGFPITKQYGQEERVALYEQAIAQPSSTVWADIAAVHTDDTCTLALPITDPINIRMYDAAFGTSTLIGAFAVWQQELPRME